MARAPDSLWSSSPCEGESGPEPSESRLSVLFFLCFPIPPALWSCSAAECPALAAAQGHCPVRPQFLGVNPRLCTGASLAGSEAWPTAFPSPRDPRLLFLSPRKGSALGGDPALSLLVCGSLPQPPLLAPVPFSPGMQLSLAS